MKQATIIKYGHAAEAFKIQETTLPAPKSNEVLIEVEGFGLNYADVMARNGLYKEAPKIPFVPGYEVVGRIIKIGTEVPEYLIGKRVVAFTRFGGYATKSNFWGRSLCTGHPVLHRILHDPLFSANAQRRNCLSAFLCGWCRYSTHPTVSP